MNARDEQINELGAIYQDTLNRGHGIISRFEQGTRAAEAILAAGYRKAEPLWVDSLTNDGRYEYTVSSDCDGSNVQYWKRVPGKTYIEAASPWEAYDPEAQS
jgi:hypothetical protein